MHLSKRQCMSSSNIKVDKTRRFWAAALIAFSSAVESIMGALSAWSFEALAVVATALSFCFWDMYSPIFPELRRPSWTQTIV